MAAMIMWSFSYWNGKPWQTGLDELGFPRHIFMVKLAASWFLGAAFELKSKLINN